MLHSLKRSVQTLVVLLLVSTLWGCGGEQTLTEMERKAVAPGYSLNDLYGDLHTLEDLKGKPVILNFWASWCPPCVKEIPSMNRGWEKIKDEGIAMVAINVGESAATVIKFKEKHPVDFTVLLNEPGDIVDKWAVRGMPTTYIIDPQGRVVYQAVGERHWDDDALLDKVRALRE